MPDLPIPEGPDHLAVRMPPGAYRFEAPALRAPLKFAWVQHQTDATPLEAFLTPAVDVLSIHSSSFRVRTWLEGQLIYDGQVPEDAISLVPHGLKSEVSLCGDIDILQVFLPRETLVEASTEVLGCWQEPHIDGFASNDLIVKLMRRAAAASQCPDAGALLVADVVGFEALRHLILNFADGGSGARRLLPSHGGLAPVQLRRATEMMESAFERGIRVPEVAQELGMSPFHFIRAFTGSAGLPPHRWLARRRTAIAKELLTSNVELAEVAYRTGYATAKSFSAAFKRATGASPSTWRGVAGSLTLQPPSKLP